MSSKEISNFDDIDLIDNKDSFKLLKLKIFIERNETVSANNISNSDIKDTKK